MTLPLELITTSDLVDELKRRYPTLLCIGRVPTGVETVDSTELVCYEGDIYELLSIAVVAQDDLLQHRRDRIEPTDNAP